MSDLVESIVDGQHTRSNVKHVIAQLEEVGVRGVPIPEELSRAVPLVIAQLMKSDSPRIKAAAVKLTIAALKHNLELAEFADKSDRLDSGQPTEAVKWYGVDTPVSAV